MGVGYTPSWLVSLWEGRIWTYRQTSGYMCVGERPCEGSGRKCHGEKPRRNQTCHLDLQISAPRTVRNRFLLLKPSSLAFYYGNLGWLIPPSRMEIVDWHQRPFQCPSRVSPVPQKTRTQCWMSLSVLNVNVSSISCPLWSIQKVEVRQGPSFSCCECC